MYYLLYVDDYEMPSKVATDPEEPCLGCIQVDHVTLPQSLAAIKLYISRVEGIPALAYADLFSNISCNTPLEEGHTSILGTDFPGLSPKKPMAIVKDRSISIPNVRYVIKNRAADIHWAWVNPIYWPPMLRRRKDIITTVHFRPTTMSEAKIDGLSQVKRHSPIIQVFRE